MSILLYKTKLSNEFEKINDVTENHNKYVAESIIKNLKDLLNNSIFSTTDTGFYALTFPYTGSSTLKSFEILDTSENLANDLENITEQTETSLAIADCIVKRIKEAIEEGTLTMQTTGAYTPPASSPINIINKPSDNCKVTIITDSVEKLNLANDFNSMGNTTKNLNVADSIAKVVKNMITSMIIAPSWTGDLMASGIKTNITVI